MTFRGIYRDGVVYLEQSEGLRNGQVVEVARVQRSSSAKALRGVKAASRSPKKLSKRATRAKSERPLPGFGAWKHRTDITDAAAFARSLRRQASRRRDGTT